MDEYQWLLLAQLLRRYDSLLTAVDLLRKMYPDNRRMAQMEEGLRKGLELKDILGSDRFEGSLKAYVPYLDLASCIEVVVRRSGQLKKMRSRFVSQVSYQLLLFVSALVIMTVFGSYVLPNMISVLEISGQRTQNIVRLFSAVKVLRDLLIAAVSVLCICGFYILKKHRQNYLWMLMHRLHHDRLIRTLASYQFAGELELLLSASVSLPDALEILRFQRSDSFTSLLAYHFHDSLMNGLQLSDSLKNEYFDEQFTAIALYGLQDDSFRQSLTDYRCAVEKRIERALKKLTAALSVLCYGFVFIIIILAYQVLLLPLELLEGL